MIYFKLPFNEGLHTVEETNDKDAVNFYSYNSLTQINFNGNIIKADPIKFHDLSVTNEFLPEDTTGFTAETKEEYCNTLQQVIEIIKENNLPKLVYSRRKIFTAFNTIDYKASFENLCQSYPNAFRYLFNDRENAWMGAFSEVLGKFNKATHEFETMALAGTLPVSEEWTEKEIEEQKPVTSYIQTILKNYSDQVQQSETYDHVSGNIKHLRTDFKTTIKPDDLDNLIQDLHPTPAVCGIPKDFCNENIRKYEKFPREFYAGYIKVETEESVLYFVNLRCARLYKDSVHVFVGGGITAQSNPEKEWTETELKSEAILKNLVVS
ncbi:chorismate-binding protein [Chryseobacterium sp. BIGb0232]|uniref:chorismate-binding protein n=1 Tax=Chryseobacterium sp. BIGb0232 TaxID=2940598 RepID=UPI000F498DB3|nr:chorismate-binding protein [Chryseobacterium sp. BIGb0232]MCS4301339.1 isochorismate synthase [Chryseobacterium sp. BIGb0232]ROS19801.1 isochorismate synthase [Chryseobacterium nakagawai]